MVGWNLSLKPVDRTQVGADAGIRNGERQFGAVRPEATERTASW